MAYGVTTGLVRDHRNQSVAGGVLDDCGQAGALTEMAIIPGRTEARHRTSLRPHSACWTDSVCNAHRVVLSAARQDETVRGRPVCQVGGIVSIGIGLRTVLRIASDGPDHRHHGHLGPRHRTGRTSREAAGRSRATPVIRRGGRKAVAAPAESPSNQAVRLPRARRPCIRGRWRMYYARSARLVRTPAPDRAPLR